jgi:hypothetical protein
VDTVNEEFENFNDQDEEWLTELEIRASDLENELIDWREARARDLAETSYGRDTAPRRTREARTGAVRAQGPRRQAPPPGAQPGEAMHHVIEDEDLDQDEDDLTTIIRTGSRPEWPHAGPTPRERTQTLIDRGRRSAGRARRSRSRYLVLGTAGLALVVAIAAFFLFRSSPSWPPSVATVQSEITTACQNPNVASEPGQTNFACGKTTSQILWVFALMTSGNNPQFTDAKSGRQGLEPITPTQGGEVAWSLDLHHPYNPYDPVDSLTVAARAINNIIGGATLTSANGKPAVQPGLLSDPGNCAKYTGSSAVVARAGFPSVCAQPVSTGTGQAALVSDAYKQWMVGATAASAYDVSVLFANATDPGNAQVQAILKTLPGAS